MNFDYVKETCSFSIRENDAAELLVRERVADYFRMMERCAADGMEASAVFVSAKLTFVLDGRDYRVWGAQNLGELTGLSALLRSCRSFAYTGEYEYADSGLYMFQPLADHMAPCMEDAAAAQHFTLRACVRSDSFEYGMVDHQPGRSPLYNEEVLQAGVQDAASWDGNWIVTDIRFPETADASRIRPLMDELLTRWGEPSCDDWNNLEDTYKGNIEFCGAISLHVTAEEIDAFTAHVLMVQREAAQLGGSMSMEGYLEEQAGMGLMHMQLAGERIAWRSWRA